MYRSSETAPVRATFKNYVPIQVNGFAGVAIVDSGNNWRTAISPKFAEKIGINTTNDLRPLPGKSTIGTAKYGTSMKILGETKHFLHLRFRDHATKYKERFVVIEGLRGLMNISGPFLHKHKIEQIHSTNQLRINGKFINMCKETSHINQIEKIRSDVVVQEDCTIPPHSYGMWRSYIIHHLYITHITLVSLRQ